VVKPEELSKVLSHALRHEPWVYELELDDEGWASLDAVLSMLREERAEWRDLSRGDVEGMIASCPKTRSAALCGVPPIVCWRAPGTAQNGAARP
jgi:putative RNA 2'-phosphotransferase